MGRGMRQALAVAASCLVWTAIAYTNQSSINSMRAQLALLENGSKDCPPCFNCNLPVFKCSQYATCSEFNGKCQCPPGFGGDDCIEPLCGSLVRENDERPRQQGRACECDDGWAGVNCNVCTRHSVCDGLMANGDGGFCYTGGEVVKQNFQNCEVTNPAIRKLLDEKVPEVTFGCDGATGKCDFQFWIDARESFMCQLSECESGSDMSAERNRTTYKCEKVQCDCVPGRMLCGEKDSIDLTEFFENGVQGPGSFECVQEAGGANKCRFNEPGMNELVTDVFGEPSIGLTCRAGECLYYSEVPGFERPVKRINGPVMAGVIAACSLFVVAVILLTYYLQRKKYGYGPIHLDDSDDEAIKLMTDHSPATLYFDKVTYRLAGKEILSGIGGIAHAGEVTAIMGASGAGKTTFLDILARKNKRGEVEGDFLVNGEKVKDVDYKSAVGFVHQEDSMLPTLTVHETILTSALLRLPKGMGQAAKEQRVYEVEKQLGIYHIRDSLIGSDDGKSRGISGGEKRRVGIACELVTSPSILFLDEPTSGLDAYNAYNVIECLVRLARTYKRTVILTIHQPRSNIVALFDRLVLLAQGRTVYSGPVGQCQEYFDRIGYSCPSGFNIADYLVDLTMHALSSFPSDDGTLSVDAGSIGPSSTRAVKSIASVSVAESMGDDSGAEASSSLSLRPPNKRRDSIRRRQERELYTRRRQTLDTAASSDAGDEMGAYRLQARPLRKPPSPTHDAHDSHDTHDIHQLPPAVGSELDVLIRSFGQSDIAATAYEDMQQAVVAAVAAMSGHGADADANPNPNPNGHAAKLACGVMGKGYARVGYWRQFIILSRRTWRNLYRDPMLMLTHYAIAIVLAVFAGFLFYGLTDDIAGFQNRLGLFFFILALFGFSTLTTLSVFSAERLLFVRERANGYYSPLTYFAAKVVFDIVPLRILPPILLGSILYPMTGLVAETGKFFIFLLVLVLFNLAAATICLFIGIVCKNDGVANLIGSLVMLFSLLFAGLLLNHDAIPASARWLQWLSIFHYGFEALIVNEVVGLNLYEHKYGIDISVPGATILSSFGFKNAAMWQDIVSLAGLAAAFIVLAYVAMHVLLIERR